MRLRIGIAVACFLVVQACSKSTPETSTSAARQAAIDQHQLQALVIEQTGQQRVAIPGVILAVDGAIAADLEKMHAGSRSAVIAPTEVDAFRRAVQGWGKGDHQAADHRAGACRLTTMTRADGPKSALVGPDSSRGLGEALCEVLAAGSHAPGVLDDFASGMGWH